MGMRRLGCGGGLLQIQEQPAARLLMCRIASTAAWPAQRRSEFSSCLLGTRELFPQTSQRLPLNDDNELLLEQHQGVTWHFTGTIAEDKATEVPLRGENS